MQLGDAPESPIAPLHSSLDINPMVNRRTESLFVRPRNGIGPQRTRGRPSIFRALAADDPKATPLKRRANAIGLPETDGID